jgi:hypothetical protein
MEINSYLLLVVKVIMIPKHIVTNLVFSQVHKKCHKLLYKLHKLIQLPLILLMYGAYLVLHYMWYLMLLLNL